MKKIISGALALAAILTMNITAVTAGTVKAAAESAYHQENNWTLTRAAIESTEQGLKISQLEKGTPDNHAIAIYEVPFEDLDTFEITFRITMEDFVATGRNANDVWTAVNIMGVPEFFNWRNCKEEEKSPTTGYGWAKDTPGFATRFLSYDGDLRIISDIYQAGYRTAGDDPTSQTVDTWTLLQTSAGASITKDVTMRLQYDADDAGGGFYSMYINGTKVSVQDELAFIDRTVLFPENKLYLTVVMNTQNKESNALSNIVIKSINGESLAANKPEDSAPDSTTDSTADSTVTPPVSEKPADKESGGCGGFIGGGVMSVALLFVAGTLLKRKEN